MRQKSIVTFTIDSDIRDDLILEADARGAYLSQLLRNIVSNYHKQRNGNQFHKLDSLKQDDSLAARQKRVAEVRPKQSSGSVKRPNLRQWLIKGQRSDLE